MLDDLGRTYIQLHTTTAVDKKRNLLLLVTIGLTQKNVFDNMFYSAKQSEPDILQQKEYM